MSTTEPEGPHPHEPSAKEVRGYSKAFRRLGERIREGKCLKDNLECLRAEMCEVYPAEAGQLVFICLQATALTDFLGYVLDVYEWQYHPKIESVPGKGTFEYVDGHRDVEAFHLRHIVELFRLEQSTREAPPWDLPSEEKEAELRALRSIIWFRTIRGWLGISRPARFRPDLEEIFHGWPLAVDAHRLMGEAGSEAGVSRHAAEWMSKYNYYPCAQEGTVMLRVLLAHADIQAAACELMADILQHEAGVLEEIAKQKTATEEDKTPEATSSTADQDSASGEEKRAESTAEPLAIRTEQVMRILGDHGVAGIANTRKARDWCRKRELRSYSRQGWASEFGSDPPQSRGEPRFYNSADVLRAAMEEGKRLETAEEIIAERNRLQKEMREAKQAKGKPPGA